MVCYIPRKRPSDDQKTLSFSLLLAMPSALLVSVACLPVLAEEMVETLELAYHMPVEASSVASESYKKKHVQISQGLQPLSYYLQEKSANHQEVAQHSPYFARKMQQERKNGKAAVLRHAIGNPLPPVPNFSAIQGTQFSQDDIFYEEETPPVVEDITVKARENVVVVEDLTDAQEPPAIKIHKDAVVYDAPLESHGQPAVTAAAIFPMEAAAPVESLSPIEAAESVEVATESPEVVPQQSLMQAEQPQERPEIIAQEYPAMEENLVMATDMPPQPQEIGKVSDASLEAPEAQITAMTAAPPVDNLLPWLQQKEAEKMAQIAPASGSQPQQMPSVTQAQEQGEAPGLRYLSAMPDDLAEEGVQEMGLAIPPEVMEREPVNPLMALTEPAEPEELLPDIPTHEKVEEQAMIAEPVVVEASETRPAMEDKSLADFLELDEPEAENMQDQKPAAIVLGEISPELMDPSALQPMADVSEPQALQSEASTEKEAGTLPWATPQAMPLIQQMPLDDVKAAEISAAKEKQPLRKAARKAAQGPTQEEVAIALAAIEEKQLPEISPAAKAKDDLLVVKSRPLIIEKKIIPATAKLDPVTSKLLNEIPAGTLEEKPLFTEEEVKVARVDVPSLEVDADAISQHEGTGIHIQVKKSGIKVDEYLRKARDGLNAGEFERAIAYYQAVLDSNKQNKHALFGLATSYHRSGELPLAKQYYQRLLQQDGGHKPALHNMMVLISQQSDGDSLPYLHELQAKNPTVAAIPAHIALIYARQVRYGDAIQKLQEAIRLAPEDASYHYHLAVILDNAGYHTEAIRAYQRVEKLYQNGANIPVAIMDIQQRLTFLLSNVPA